MNGHVSPVTNLAQAVLFIRRAALDLPERDSELLSGLASTLQRLIVEKSSNRGSAAK